MRTLRPQLIERLAILRSPYSHSQFLALLQFTRSRSSPSTHPGDGGDGLRDGICETARGNRVCTLRAAIMESNAQARIGQHQLQNSDDRS
jgi:hypothetical protein